MVQNTVSDFVVCDPDAGVAPPDERDAARVAAGGWAYPKLVSAPRTAAARAKGAATRDNEWQIGCDDAGALHIAYGTTGGAVRTERIQVIPKAGRTLHEQCTLEARSRYLRKARNHDYVRHSTGGAHTPEGAPPRPRNLMLAGKWSPEDSDIAFPVGVQPKLDGMRCGVRLEHSGDDGAPRIAYRTRSNREWPPAVHSRFSTEARALLDLLPNAAELDGELYAHGLSFQQLSSVLRRERSATPASLERVEYWVFTYVPREPEPAEDRYCALQCAFEQAAGARIKLVEMNNAMSIADVVKLHDTYVGQGYEGAMLYKYAMSSGGDAADYKHGRSNNLLKFKCFYDAEGDVVRVLGHRQLENAAAIEDAVASHDPRHIRVVVRVGDHDVPMRPAGKTADVLEDLAQAVAAIARGERVRGTFRYQELSDNGVPRFPVFSSIRPELST